MRNKSNEFEKMNGNNLLNLNNFFIFLLFFFLFVFFLLHFLSNFLKTKHNLKKLACENDII